MDGFGTVTRVNDETGETKPCDYTMVDGDSNCRFEYLITAKYTCTYTPDPAETFQGWGSPPTNPKTEFDCSGGDPIIATATSDLFWQEVPDLIEVAETETTNVNYVLNAKFEDGPNEGRPAPDTQLDFRLFEPRAYKRITQRVTAQAGDVAGDIAFPVGKTLVIAAWNSANENGKRTVYYDWQSWMVKKGEGIGHDFKLTSRTYTVETKLVSGALSKDLSLILKTLLRFEGGNSVLLDQRAPETLGYYKGKTRFNRVPRYPTNLRVEWGDKKDEGREIRVFVKKNVFVEDTPFVIDLESPLPQ